MMESYHNANNRILMNTILLYSRMIISTLVSLYTSRIVLDALGVSDYGIYNVVAGFVTLLAFVNGSMVASTRRFLTISLAGDPLEQQRKIFSTSFYIHLGIAILITIVAVSFGYWFIQHKMTIPADRVVSAKWVFTYSLFAIISLCITVPHNALVIANEKMGVFAALSLVEVFLKLVIAIVITHAHSDKLVLYALLTNSVAVLTRVLYVVYCHYKFENVSYELSWDSRLYKCMLSFAGWNVFSAMSISLYNQGINILLNVFFTPVVNAARAIAVQVQGLTTLLATNFQQAVNPQITKSHAIGDYDRTLSLIFRSTKFSFVLVFLVTFPIIIETKYILQLWLGELPNYTVRFVQLSLLIVLFEVITNPITTAVLATGHIRKYQIVVGIIQLSVIGFVYLGLKIGVGPVGVYIINLIMILLLYAVKIIIAIPLIRMNILEYLRFAIVPIFLCSTMSIIFYYILHFIIANNSVGNIFIAFISASSTALIFGLSKSERVYILNQMKSRYGKKM